jgi:hypothetical protein
MIREIYIEKRKKAKEEVEGWKKRWKGGSEIPDFQ